jgi:hypothetical protein
MSYNLENLQPEIKEELLKELHAQIGDHNYNELLSSIGEEGLLQAILIMKASDKKPSSSERVKNAGLSWIIAYLLIGVVSGLLAYLHGGDFLSGMARAIPFLIFGT